MKRKVIAHVILALSFVILVLSYQVSYSASINKVTQFEIDVETQLCMVIDGSLSIGSSEWDTIKQGIAKAINTTTPHDGSVELTIVQFGYSPADGYAKTEIPPTVIDSTNRGTIANRVLRITQGGFGTPMAHGLNLGWEEISNSPNFEIAINQIINLATDGVPSRRNNYATSDLDGDGHIDYWDDIIAVVNNAVDQGLEELDIEGIGIANSSRDWFRNWTVHPQPGILAPPFSKPGWIRVVANATEFANTIDQKFQVVVPEETYTLMVDIVGNGSVVKDPDQATYSYGASVELTATADPGWTFSHWSGDLTGSTNPDSITMDDNKTVTANFTQDQYTLAVNIVGSGSVSKDPDQATYTYGTTVEVSAIPDSCYEFDHWELDSVNTGSANPYMVGMDGDHTLHAVFTQIENALTVNVAGSGSVTKNPDLATYPCGTAVTLTAIPNSGWSFSHWSDDLSGSANPETITMDVDKTVTAHFTQKQYTLTINIVGNGFIIKDPDQTTYPHSTVVELTADPDPGWVFSHWSGDLTGSTNPDSITMDDNKTVTANFTQDQYTLAVNIVGSGSVSKVPDQATYSYGASVELTATADPGWTFSHWSGDLTGSTNPDSITMDDNKTVTANFTQDQIWVPSVRDAVAGGVATVAITSMLTAMSSSLASPAASAGSSFWSRIAAALPDSLQNLLQSYGEEILASKTQKEIGAKEVSRLVITPTEVLAFVLGAATLTFCFSYAIAGATAEILNVVPIAFGTVVVAELVYWLTMEVVARSMGICSEYNVWPIGIVMLLVSTLAFRSPFCVAGRSRFECAKPTKRSFGLISLSGPVACLLLGGIFAMLLSFGYEQLGSLGVMVCMTKATFDLIPTAPMNGKEIFDWNKIIWLLFILPSAASYIFFILNF